jgi:hypothetical protein
VAALAEVKEQLHHLQAQTKDTLLQEDLAAENMEQELVAVELVLQDKEMMVVLVVLVLDLAVEEKVLLVRLPVQVVVADPVVMV